MADDDPAKEFQTYLFFLRHFEELIWDDRAGYGNHNALVTALVADQKPLLCGIGQVQLSDADRQRLRKYLFASWNGEAVSRLSTLHPKEVRRFTNQWKPVQAYYAIYFQLVGLQFALTGAASGAHAATVSYGTSNACQRLPAPWRLRLNYEAMTLVDFPKVVNLKPAGGWNLANIDAREFVANFLRSTGERKQHEVWTKEYRGKKKKVMANGPRKGKRYRIRDVHVGHLSFFDIMWRFRTWANYREADTIIEGGDFELWAVEFDEAFNTIVQSTATVIEHIIGRRIGRQTLQSLYAEYLALTHGTLSCPGIQMRRDLVCSELP